MTDDNRDNITHEEALIEGRCATAEHDIRAVTKIQVRSNARYKRHHSKAIRLPEVRLNGIKRLARI
jgi:hypothetical protein